MYRDRAQERREGVILDIKRETKGLDPLLKQKLMEQSEIAVKVVDMHQGEKDETKFTTNVGKRLVNFIENGVPPPDFTKIRYGLLENGEIAISHRKESLTVRSGLSDDVIATIGKAIRKNISNPVQPIAQKVEDDVDNIFDDVDSDYVCEARKSEPTPIVSNIFSASVTVATKGDILVEEEDEDMFKDFERSTNPQILLTENIEESMDSDQDELVRQEFQRDLASLQQGDNDVPSNVDDYVECYPDTLGMTNQPPTKRKFEGKEKHRKKKRD
jgi:hypothetical protein